jgi:ArsR family transcriptional regulator, arsenate/arsenite/antimonite-responsive transcriptional repressor
MQQLKPEVEQTSQILKLLGDKTRLTIVALLLKRKLCVCEFQEVFEMSQSSISQHLRKLKDATLVKESRKGQWIFYSLNKNNDFYPLLEHVVMAYLPDQAEKLELIDKNNPTLRCGC